MLGSGGREHALAWKLAQSPLCDKLWAAPGNPGIAQHAECTALDVADHEAVVAFCSDHAIGLVVIGPEAPLVDGLADSLRVAGIDTFGPSREAAQLEGSKGFTKELCKRANIPTARYERCVSLEQAWGALKRFDPPFVLKADGLAAGKGVVIAETYEEAQHALNEIATALPSLQTDGRTLVHTTCKVVQRCAADAELTLTCTPALKDAVVTQVRARVGRLLGVLGRASASLGSWSLLSIMGWFSPTSSIV